MPFPSTFDEVYFSDRSWSERVTAWIKTNEAQGFSSENAALVRRVLSDDDTGLRIVINITPGALTSVLREGEYKNLYEHPVIGGAAKEVPASRLTVDEALDLDEHTYFGALALGGSGVRFYGQYCLVLRPDHDDASTHLFDRDSYDILFPPLATDHPADVDLVACLRGTWVDDRLDMAMLKVLPEIRHDNRLVTSGTISDLLLRDQEFIEVHLHGSIGIDRLEEIRESPDDATTELAILERSRNGLRTSTVDREWIRRRALLAELMDHRKIPHHVVTIYGKGYQWA